MSGALSDPLQITIWQQVIMTASLHTRGHEQSAAPVAVVAPEGGRAVAIGDIHVVPLGAGPAGHADAAAAVLCRAAAGLPAAAVLSEKAGVAAVAAP